MLDKININDPEALDTQLNELSTIAKDLENVLNDLENEFRWIKTGYDSEKSRKYSELMSNYASEATQIVKNIDSISQTLRDYNRKMRAIDES